MIMNYLTLSNGVNLAYDGYFNVLLLSLCLFWALIMEQSWTLLGCVTPFIPVWLSFYRSTLHFHLNINSETDEALVIHEGK